MRYSNNKMLHGFYSRLDAKKNGKQMMRNRKGRKVTVTETSQDGSCESTAKDLSYVGLVRPWRS